MQLNPCAIYVRPGNEHDIKKEWGGCHITMAGFQTTSPQDSLTKIQALAINNYAQGNKLWQPSDYAIENWKGRFTMVIKSKTLNQIAQDLEACGFQRLKGPKKAG